MLSSASGKRIAAAPIRAVPAAVVKNNFPKPPPPMPNDHAGAMALISAGEAIMGYDPANWAGSLTAGAGAYMKSRQASRDRTQAGERRQYTDAMQQALAERKFGQEDLDRNERARRTDLQSADKGLDRLAKATEYVSDDVWRREALNAKITSAHQLATAKIRKEMEKLGQTRDINEAVAQKLAEAKLKAQGIMNGLKRDGLDLKMQLGVKGSAIGEEVDFLMGLKIDDEGAPTSASPKFPAGARRRVQVLAAKLMVDKKLSATVAAAAALDLLLVENNPPGTFWGTNAAIWKYKPGMSGDILWSRVPKSQ